MSKDKERYPCENYTKQLITDYLVPGMKAMLREELNKISQYESITKLHEDRICALEDQMKEVAGLTGKEIIERLLKQDG